ncbi:MAG: glycosyltransferase [Mycobacterium sp.]|nr:glycosyltransferase [Mycobacterium sp.]
MRVVRVVAKLEPGGAQLAALRLSRELSRRYGVRTTLLVGDATPDGLTLARRYKLDTHVFRVAPTLHPVRNLQWERSTRFANWLRDKIVDADLVHAHMVGAWWAASRVVAPHTPLVATEHNQVNWPLKRVRSLHIDARRIDKFYAMGPAAFRFAIDAGVRPDVIAVARSPVAGLRASSRLSLPVPRLTFAGRLSSDKGPDLLVEALTRLDLRRLTAYLLGDGPLRDRLMDRIDSVGLSGRVLMPGWVSQPWRYVAGSNVHVVPSREEAWSQSAVLALALGVPVIGTNVDGLAETLSQSRGIIVPPNDPDALAAAIGDTLSGRAATDRIAAMRYARNFTAARVAKFYHAEYQTLRERAALAH